MIERQVMQDVQHRSERRSTRSRRATGHQLAADIARVTAWLGSATSLSGTVRGGNSPRTGFRRPSPNSSTLSDRGLSTTGESVCTQSTQQCPAAT